MQIQSRPVVRPAARPLAAAAIAPVAPATAVKQPQAPAVKAQAQGGIKTGVQIFQAAAGTIGGGMGGAALGFCGWFMANAGGAALSSNVIGLGLLAGAALGGYIGWKNGAFWGGAVEETLKK